MVSYQKHLVTMSIQDIGRPRYALIFGIGEHSSPLKNATNDAGDMSARLEGGCSFNVTVGINQTYEEMREELRKFKLMVNSRENLKQGRVVLVYFSGHGGLDSRGRQILCPNDTRHYILQKLFSAKEISFESEIVEFLNPLTQENTNSTGLKQHELRQRNINIFIVDACRSTTSKDVVPSLPNCPGSYLVFSCQPFGVSFDGEGQNGNYTTCLLQALVRGNQLRFNDLFSQAKLLATSYVDSIPGATPPQIIDNTIGEFIFQYHPKFHRQVQKIQNEIFKKDPESVWHNLKSLVDINWKRLSSIFSGGQEESKSSR